MTFNDFLKNPTVYVLSKTIKVLNKNDETSTQRILNVINNYGKTTERFYPKNSDLEYLPLIIGLIAAYISWNCNSRKGYTLLEKIIFSFFAFIFGGVYLLYYFLVRYDECK
jgi:hypothetical protein|uniref:Uncharacterized protein n=1 Tax=viral metagenome TaxID=1070528 RepID=A0A6C0HDB8_9ZZZZ